MPPGQQEAARSTGMNRLQSLPWVEIPQALRNVFPDLVSNMIEVVKLTTIASVVPVPDMLYAARTAQSMLYNPTPIVLAAIGAAPGIEAKLRQSGPRVNFTLLY